MQARMKYGTGTYDSFFSSLYSFYPSTFTIGENMKLTRQLFPLLFQLVLIFCDLTIDAPSTLTEEEETDKKQAEDKFVEYARRLDEVLGEVKEVMAKDAVATDDLQALYVKIRELDQDNYQKMVMLLQEERAARPQGWTVFNVIKKLVGVLILFSIVKMICFPAAAPKTDDELVREASKSWKLTKEDVLSIKRLRTEDEQRDAYNKLYLLKIEENKKKLKKEEEAKDQKAKDYFKEKIEGKAT